MERIINNQLLDYLLSNQLISKQQHGFIRKRGTCTNILESLHDWCLNLQSRFTTDIIYFDFKKAFDSVSHPKLLVKLQAYGITGNLFTWLTEFLHGRSQTVKLGVTRSHPVHVLSGVPQGSVLGPTLFLLYINDICDIFDGLNVTCKLYADDIKLYSSYNVNVPQYDLMIAISRLHNWSVTWQLQIAIDKCFVCTVSNVYHNPECSTRVYGIRDQTFASVDCVRDLGVMVDSKLKFDKHIAELTHKAMSRANLILKSFHSRDRTLLTTAFCTYVRPLLEYCSPVWSPHTQCLINKIEKVQRHFTKRIAGLWSMSYDKRLRTLGLQSLEYRRVINDLILYYKIKNGLLDTDISNNFIAADNLNTRGHSCKLIKQHCTMDATKFYFTNRIVSIWNSLSEDVVCAPSVSAFKHRLSQFTVTF